MNIYAISSFSAAFLLYVLAFFVYLNDREKFVNKVYAIQCLVIGGWIWGCFGESIIKNYQFIIYLDKLLNIFAVFSPILFLHTNCALIEKKIDKIVKFLYGVSIFLFAISFSPFYIKGVVYRYGVRYISDPGPLYLIFIVYTAYCLLLSLYRVWKFRKDADHQKRLQLTYVFIASTSMTIAAGIYLAMVFNIAISPLDNTLNSIYGILVAYAIVRHRLMDIEVIIRKTLVFAGLLASVFAILILPTLLIQEYITRGASFGGKLTGLTISGIIIILIMRRIESFLINITDRYLFQKKYNYKELLKTFTTEVLTVLELDKLVNLTVTKLVDIIKLNSCAVLLYDDERKKLNIAASYNMKNPLDKHSAEITLPMTMHSDTIGMLLLGKKKSDERYTQDDLDILLPLAKTLAIAISNAELLRKLSKAQTESARKEKMAVIGTLAAGMAHEIRNPLTTIRTFADYLPEKFEDKVFIRKFKQIIPGEIGRIENVAWSLLEFSGAEETQKNESVDLVDVIKVVIALLEPQYRFFDIKMDIVFNGMTAVIANKRQLQNAFFNIIKYITSETPAANVVSIMIDGTNDRVAVDIADSRLVVADYIIKDIFEPVAKISRERRGFGFDLFIAKELLEKNKGTLAIFSDKEKGTRFNSIFMCAPEPRS